MSRIGLALYGVAARMAQPFVLRKLRRRGQAEPGYLEAVGERFGRYEQPAVPGALWIHAVSLGETRAAAVLLEALRAREPGLRVLLTHGTATGRAEGRRLLRPGDVQAWLPWDTPEAVQAFLDHFQPRAGLLMETEVWPILVAACADRGVPLALANARLSEASLAATLRLGPLSRPAYRALSAVWAQTEADAQRLASAGARVDAVMGNLKFDATPPPALLAQAATWRERARAAGPGGGRPVLMFASSREGEEAMLLQALATMSRRSRLLVVPRHPQRFDEVARLLESAGLSVSRRSQWQDGPDADALAADAWLGDSLGEMPLYYGLADAALLGGSFAPLGGQNLIEACACGCPVVMGPHTFNFADAADLAEAADAASRQPDIAAALAQAEALLADASRQSAMAEAGRAFAQAHRGAAARTADAVLALAAG